MPRSHFTPKRQACVPRRSRPSRQRTRRWPISITRRLAGCRASSSARCLLALALAQRGDAAAAENTVGRIAFASAVQRKHFGPFRDAVLAFVRQSRPEGPQLEPALGRLRGTLLAGYAPLVERLRDRDRAEPREAGLSAAERAVLAHVQRGLSSKEIAAAMSRSPQTVDTHVKSILRKLNCRGRSEAVYVARRRGLLD